MSVTPKKFVRWDFDNISFSDFNSPNASSDSMVSTSSLEYINSLLVAHGFAPSPGLSLDGVSNGDSERVVKCLLGLLSQRIEDMNRTEELTTKLRTLTYDHERILSMHRTTTERAANAEREMNLHKSRLTASLRTLQTTEIAHKQTTAELQRTRTSLQAIRATYHAEIKKKEKDIERMTDKWQKLAEAQTKISMAPSGMSCANVGVVEGNEVIGRGQGFLDIALQEAEKARADLLQDNTYLKSLVLKAVNGVQAILHNANSLISEAEDKPVPYTMTTLFPMSPLTAPGERLSSVLSGLRQCMTTLSERLVNPPPTTTPKSCPKVSDEEVERLEGIIINLKEELVRCQQQSTLQATQTQAMFDKLTEQRRATTADIDDMSVELISAPLQDEEKGRLERIRMELDNERQKFTDAAIKFGKEKAALEAERLRFLDEKRSWQVEMMLAELPPTPVPDSPARSSKISKKSPHKSPKKSPIKLNISVGKRGTSNGRRASRVLRRSLGSPVKVIAAFETEVLPPLLAPSYAKPQSLASASLLSTTFVLPPPSPHASLPSKPALPPPVPISPPSNDNSLAPPPSSSLPETQLTTPSAVRRPFPVAKPFAQRMVHAYSPAKPSPLSRILMLADSPIGPPLNFPIFDSPEDATQRLTHEMSPTTESEPEMSLAAQLGVTESPPDTPLQEKRLEINVMIPPRGVAPPQGMGKMLLPEQKKIIPPTTKGKGKAKAKAEPVPVRRPTITATNEKENNGVKKGKVSPVFKPSLTTTTKGSSSSVGATATNAKPFAKNIATSRAAVRSAKVPPPVVGGPRRVLVTSSEAPPLVGRR